MEARSSRCWAETKDRKIGQSSVLFFSVYSVLCILTNTYIWNFLNHSITTLLLAKQMVGEIVENNEIIITPHKIRCATDSFLVDSLEACTEKKILKFFLRDRLRCHIKVGSFDRHLSQGDGSKLPGKWHLDCNSVSLRFLFFFYIQSLIYLLFFVFLLLFFCNHSKKKSCYPPPSLTTTPQ